MDTDVTSNFHVKPRYLIFGASGFLGSRIFEVLSDNWDTFGTFHNASMPQSNKMRKVNLSEEAEMLSALTILNLLKTSLEVNQTIRTGLINMVLPRFWQKN